MLENESDQVIVQLDEETTDIFLSAVRDSQINPLNLSPEDFFTRMVMYCLLIEELD